MEKIYKFDAVIQSLDKYKGSGFIQLPFDVKEEFGTSGQVKVDVTFDGHRYRGSISNMGDGHFVLMKKDVRKAINKGPGETVKVVLQKDTAIREVEVPSALSELLDSNPDIKSFYESLSYTNRKEYAVWISSAKREETKEKRLSQCKEKLQQKKKNPSQ